MLPLQHGPVHLQVIPATQLVARALVIPIPIIVAQGETLSQSLALRDDNACL